MIDPRLCAPLDLAPLTLIEGDEEHGVLQGGERLYPLLAGIPILVPDPAGFVADHRDALLAWLVEGGAATPGAVDIVRRFSSDVRGADAVAFSDDWTAAEAGGDLGGFANDIDGSWAAELRELLASLGDPRDVLVEAIGDARRVVEVGPGAGLLAGRLADRDLLLVDRSPRALTVAKEHAPRASAAVMEAESLALAAGSIDALVAANVIDLLADPLSFIEGAARALAPGGRLVLTSPDPWPWDGTREGADGLLGHLGLTLTRFEDGLAWPREHGPRELQLYVTQLVVAEK